MNVLPAEESSRSLLHPRSLAKARTRDSGALATTAKFISPITNGIAKEKVVFISVHADSLHPSLRGAMAYIPGGRFVQGTYEKTDPVYLARAEVRERPVVRHSERDALMAEGLSRELAHSLVEQTKLRDPSASHGSHSTTSRPTNLCRGGQPDRQVY